METKQLIILIAEEMHKKLKMVSAKKGIPMRHLIISAIEQIIKKELK